MVRNFKVLYSRLAMHYKIKVEKAGIKKIN